MSYFDFYLYFVCGIASLVCAYLCGLAYMSSATADMGSRTKDTAFGVSFLFAIFAVLFEVMAVFAAQVFGYGQLVFVDAKNNKFVVGERYEVVGTIVGTDVIAVRNLPDGDILAYRSSFVLPKCFVVTNLSDAERFQEYPCTP